VGELTGAAVIEASRADDQGVLYCELGTDPTKAEHIWVPAGGSRLKTSETTVAERLHFMRMKGREVYKFAVTKFRETIEDALAATGLGVDDIAQFVCHQSNLRIIESAKEKLGLPDEKVHVNIDRFGNCSAGSAGLVFDQLWQAGKIKRGDTVLMVAFGGGLTWASNVWKI